MSDYTESTTKDGAKTWTKEVDYEDGSSISTVVEKVSNGFVKSVTTRKKNEDSWKFDTIKSIHNDNPLEEKSLIDKLASILNI